MPTRTGTAVWRGAGAKGQGALSTQSGALKELPYSFKMRFGDEPGTNPEELIAAAHSGCFAMALSIALDSAGHPPQELRAQAAVSIDKQGDGFAITKIALTLEAKVEGIDDATFQRIAGEAKKGCPVSKALSAVAISLEAKLAG